MRNVKLSPAQLRSWEDHGYLVSDFMVDPALLAAMREHMARVFNGEWPGERPYICSWKPGDPTDRVRQMAFAWRVDPVFRTSALLPEIGAMAAQLAGASSIRLLMDWIVYKPGIGDAPNPATGIGYHQDHGYWLETWPRNLLSARIPLDHETPRNGCMSVVPGSHRMELLPGMGNGFWIADESGQRLDMHRDLPPAVDCELQPGQVMFHHCMLIHGTGQNRTHAPRRSQNIHMMPGGTIFRAGYGHCFSGYAAQHGQQLVHGQALKGGLFPEIYSASTTRHAQPANMDMPLALPDAAPVTGPVQA